MSSTRGRPRKPTALIMLQGTAKAPRMRERAAEPDISGDGSMPPAPEDLAPEVRAAWDEIAKNMRYKIFSAEDEQALRAFATMWSLWKAMDAHIREHGVTEMSETATGRSVSKLSPECQLWLDLNGKLLHYFSRFGMTPADRSRVKDVRKLKGASGGHNPDDEFKAG